MENEILTHPVDLANTFLDSSKESIFKIARVLPDFFLAVGVLLLGWFLGHLISHGIQKLGRKLKVHHFSDKIGFTRMLRRANIKSSPSKVIGEFMKGYILTIFLIGAASLIGFDQVSEFLDEVIGYIPNVLIALLIVLLGTRVGETASAIIENTMTIARSKAAKTLSLTAKYIIITFSIMAALFQLKIAADLVQILFTGFIAMIALSGGLAFGLGGKKVVEEFLEDLKKLPSEGKSSSVRKKTERKS